MFVSAIQILYYRISFCSFFVLFVSAVQILHHSFSFCSVFQKYLFKFFFLLQFYIKTFVSVLLLFVPDCFFVSVLPSGGGGFGDKWEREIKRETGK